MRVINPPNPSIIIVFITPNPLIIIIIIIIVIIIIIITIVPSALLRVHSPRCTLPVVSGRYETTL